MFVDENDTVDIEILYKKAGKHYLALSLADFEEADYEEEEKKTFKKLTIKMKQLTWGLYNELQEGAVDLDFEGNRRFNYKKYKEARLVRLISGWSATRMDGDKEIPVPANKKTIMCLSPEIAEGILNTYDQLMYLTEEDEGK